jgi:hypothetical protein
VRIVYLRAAEAQSPTIGILEYLELVLALHIETASQNILSAYLHLND